MTATTAPVSMTATSPRPGRLALTALTVAGPLVGVASFLLAVFHTTDPAAHQVANAYAQQGRFTAYVWFDVLFGVVYAPALLVLAVLAAAGARRLGTSALAVLVVGFFAMASVASAPDYAMLAGARGGVDQSAVTRMIDKGFGTAAFGVPLTIGLLGQMVGIVLLGLALLRGRTGSPWAGWLLLASAPLLLVGFAAGLPAAAIAGFLAQSAAAALTARTLLDHGLGWTTG
jgi:hypothetical protein